MADNPTPLILVNTEKELVENRRKAVLNWLVALAVIAVFALRLPSFTQTVFVFIATLGVLVFVHEWGHYQFGRWGGMKVNRFGLGFPPWIYTKKYKGINYSIGALPIGGMVDIAGLGSEEEMIATAQSAKETGGVSTAATTVENLDAGGSRRDAELTSYMKRNPDAPHGTKNFQDAKLSWRFWTLFAGPLMNFIFALVMFIGVFSIWGVIEDQISINRVAGVRPSTPADKAGLQNGDMIVAVNGFKTDSPTIISRFIRNSGSRFIEAKSDVALSTPAGSTQIGTLSGAGFELRAEAGEKTIVPITLSVLRDGKTLTKEITPTFQEVEYMTGGGLDSMRMPALGVEFEQKMVFKKVGVVEAAKQGVLISAGMTAQLLQVVGRAFTFKLNSAERRSIGGPIKIAQEVGKAAKGGPQDLLLFAGLLSMNLGLMNLLPFPALDGGRILFLGYELVFRKPIDSKKESLVHMAGMVVLLAFMLFITVRDVLPWIERSLKSVF